MRFGSLCLEVQLLPKAMPKPNPSDSVTGLKIILLQALMLCSFPDIQFPFLHILEFALASAHLASLPSFFPRRTMQFSGYLGHNLPKTESGLFRTVTTTIRSLVEGSEPLEASERHAWPQLGAIGSPVIQAKSVVIADHSDDGLSVLLKHASSSPSTPNIRHFEIYNQYSLATISPTFDVDSIQRRIPNSGMRISPLPPPGDASRQTAMGPFPNDTAKQHPSPIYASDESEHSNSGNTHCQLGDNYTSPPNPYRPSIPLHPAARPCSDAVFDSGGDWLPASLSQLTPVELTLLITSAGLRVWEDLGGAVMLCESDGTTLAELPWARPRRCNGSTLPVAYFEDAWRRVNLGTATRTEIVELLVAARLSVQENSVGDLRLVEWAGNVRSVLRSPNQRSRRSPVS